MDTVSKILAGMFTVYVPVELKCTTGYVGTDSTSVELVELDHFDFSNKVVSPIYEDAFHTAAKENAESFGLDVEDCGECGGCQQGTGCEDPIDNDSIEYSYSEYSNPNEEPEVGAGQLTVWCEDFGLWLVVENPTLSKLVKEANTKHEVADRQATKVYRLKRDIEQLYNTSKLL